MLCIFDRCRLFRSKDQNGKGSVCHYVITDSCLAHSVPPCTGKDEPLFSLLNRLAIESGQRAPFQVFSSRKSKTHLQSYEACSVLLFVA